MSDQATSAQQKTVASVPNTAHEGVLQRKCACGQHTVAGGECEACRKKHGGMMQRAAVNTAPVTDVPPVVNEVLSSAGQPLDVGTRTFMESRFGHDFSQVRVHTDAKAAKSAQSVEAQAYTVGRDVVFGAAQYEPTTNSGQQLLAHELMHVVQQSAMPPSFNLARLTIGSKDSPYEREADRAVHAPTSEHAVSTLLLPTLQRQPQSQQADCSVRQPESCPTYEQWLQTFTVLIHPSIGKPQTFPASDTAPGGTKESKLTVLGEKPASHDPKAAKADQPPPPLGGQPADKFIDHPTDEWVRTNLPAELRATAYRLPSDCADIAIILRHVWLFYHNRTETYHDFSSGASRDWTLGIGAEKTQEARVQRIGGVIGQVYTGNVKEVVNAYSDPHDPSKPLRRFEELQKLLHPGDILVWKHHPTSGHTQTIVDVARDESGRITKLTVVNGNEPISPGANPTPEHPGGQVEEIQTFEKGKKQPVTSTEELRKAPGRRIEADELTGSFLKDQPLPRPAGSKDTGEEERVWTWPDAGGTTLVVAGPSASAVRPVQGKGAEQTLGALADWLPVLRAATAENLQGVFEAALQATRAMLEGGQAIPMTDAQSVGLSAGEQLWALAKQARDTGNRSHFERLQQMRAVIQALGRGDAQASAPGRNVTQENLRRTFTLIDDAFNVAARGGTTLDFKRKVSPGTQVVKILLTGFDPFNTSNAALPPRQGEWNPSGAAVLALDGTTIQIGKGVVAAVEGVVLPVSFEEFRGNIVERIVQPQAQNVDAILTVSVDPGLAADKPVRIERFAVGVHRLNNNVLEAVPAATSGGGGPAIIETQAPVEHIAAATARPAGQNQPAIAQPTIGNDITFRFATPQEAIRAATALGLPANSNQGQELTVGDVAALHQIMKSMQRLPNGTDIRFNAGGQAFQATVVEGPGGSFLSNEVSFRVQRLLGGAPGPHTPFSFHVHTQAGNLLPEDTNSPAAKQEREHAQQVRSTLIATLQQMIRAVANQIVGQSNVPGGKTP